ncbi:MAG: CPBP family intramembrane glutamic endopeptidase [Bacteroidota bacterium]|nr:CPBP family intramembrane glutamic endopeptidase [Bacteroidota bacterium]
MGLRSRIRIINTFIKNPDDTPYAISVWEKLKFLVSGIVYDFGFAFLFLILMSLIEPLTKGYENVLNQELYSFWMSILLITIVPPVLEEFVFRFPLKYKRNYLLRLIAYLFKLDLETFWKKHLRIIVYVFSAAFGFVHMSNYSNVDIWFFILSPILVGAQLFAGIIFSFFRLKLGFIWAILGHFSHNFILIMMAFLFYHNVMIPLVDDDAVKIEAAGLAFEVEETSILHFDTTQQGNLLCLEAQNYSLQKLVDSLYTSDTLKLRDNELINLHLLSKQDSGFTKLKFLETLQEHYVFKKVVDSTRNQK